MNAERIRVCHILEAATGGARRHVVDILRHLDRKRFAPALIASSLRDPTFAAVAQALAQEGVEVQLLQMRREVHPLADAWALRCLMKLLSRGRFDIVHTHCSKAGMLGRLAARMAGIHRVVHTPHVFSFEMKNGRAQAVFYTLLERWAARCTDRLVAVSGSNREAALAQLALPAARVTLIPNGVDAASERPDPDSAGLRRRCGLPDSVPVVGMAGRLAVQKNPGDFLRAAKIVAEKLPATHFVWIGSGELRARLLAEAQIHGLADRLKWLPDWPEGPHGYGLFDVLALPSLWEGMPYVLLEAMACGVPAAAFAVGGVPEAIEHGVSGQLVPPRRPDLLAEALLELLGDDARRQDMGRRARDRVSRNFRLETMVRSLENLYLSLV